MPSHRKIPLRDFVAITGKDVKGYRELLKTILSAQSHTAIGFPVPVMRVVVRILNCLSVPGDTLLVTEEDWKFICKRVNEFPYAFPHQELIDFIDAVNEAEVVQGSS